MRARKTVITTDIKTFRQIVKFCRRVYESAFSPEEAAEKLKNLTFIDAVKLWREGLPDSAQV